MKPSGIEWIGDIPDDWEVRKLLSLFKEHKDRNKNLEEQNLLSLSYGKIKRKDINNNDGLLPASFETYNIVEKGDIVFRLTDLQNDKRSLRTGIVTQRGIITSAYVTIRPKIKLDSRFYHYLYHMYDICKVFYGMGDGVRQGMGFEELKNIPTLIPPLKTQQKIADYLDEKCGEIDATIAKQKESIEKLKAYKQSLISETVTKGLDKSAPLKPSGIEWIGDIPDDWGVTKISRLYSIQLGKMLQPEKKSSGDTYEPYICAANLSSGTFRLDEVKYMWISEPEKDIYRLKRDDLLVTEGGDVGISSIWKDDISPCYFQNALHRVVPKKGNSNRFLHYWLIVLKSVGYIDLICNKSTIAHFTKEKFAQSLILSIPLQTQEKIADYLDSKCSQIDKYITEKQNIIQKLDTYKKSLIFECVTGKMFNLRRNL